LLGSIYIYIYREREGEREGGERRERELGYIYIYIYIERVMLEFITSSSIFTHFLLLDTILYRCRIYIYIEMFGPNIYLEC
jgi:hypothetical protein